MKSSGAEDFFSCLLLYGGKRQQPRKITEGRDRKSQENELSSHVLWGGQLQPSGCLFLSGSQAKNGFHIFEWLQNIKRRIILCGYIKIKRN